MIKYLSFILLIISFSSALSQNISGVIIDENTREPLIGVNVILSNTNGTTTNINGEFSLQLKENEKIITFKYIGYESVVLLVDKSEFNIRMKSAIHQIGTVVISAGKFEQKIEEITVSMEVISPSLIENKNTTNIQTALEQVPGLNITDGQANIRGGSGWSYGAGSRVLVMVDDMPLISGDAGQVQWKLIATENINQVEVIKGASSVLYGSSALNGVINIRTSFPKQSDIEKHESGIYFGGYTKITTHFGITDNAKRDVLNWWGDRRQLFYGTEFSHARKIGNLDLTVGGNYFQDEGYRKGEITDRKRFNFNTNYHSKKVGGLSYGVNGNFLFQSTGSVIIWNDLDQAYIPLNNEITTTSGDTYNIDPFIQYIT
ncbi:MAG: TonB-dependent receptor plug domain-containing protein, partial [Flavobacteriales bacterium]